MPGHTLHQKYYPGCALLSLSAYVLVSTHTQRLLTRNTFCVVVFISRRKKVVLPFIVQSRCWTKSCTVFDFDILLPPPFLPCVEHKVFSVAKVELKKLVHCLRVFLLSESIYTLSPGYRGGKKCLMLRCITCLKM